MLACAATWLTPTGRQTTIGVPLQMGCRCQLVFPIMVKASVMSSAQVQRVLEAITAKVPR